MTGGRPPLRDGLDAIGPFHPYVVYAGVLLLDLAILLFVLAAFTFVGDTVEDLIWPGGPEWVDL